MRSKPILFYCLLALLSTEGTKATDKSHGASKTILAHYMPWYSAKPRSENWGWHWTMDRFDPDTILENGRREAASHDYPLAGLYDSSDPDLLECQVLQMKFAGIGGVIIDWYGTRDFYDYARVHENTKALIPVIEKAGLKFAICYEDQAVGKMVRGNNLPEEKAVEHAREVLAWVEKEWFSRDSYLHHQGRPVLVCFGPQYFEPEAWQKVIGSFATKPWIHTIAHLAEKYNADGPFGWPPVHGGKTLAPSQWQKSLERLYARSKTGEAVMGVIFPGYHDIYQQAGLHDPYGYIDDRGGKTLMETLDLALASEATLIQAATWNDYGEGTVIEPTKNHGYRYLEEIQRRMQPGFDAGTLRLPMRLFHLRKQANGKHLDNIAKLLFSGKTTSAAIALEKAEAAFRAKKQPGSEHSYQTKTEILYRSGANVTEYMKQRCRLDLYYPETAKDYPTVIWFHAGGLKAGEKFIPGELMKRGIGVAAVNYRLSPKVKAPAYIEDAAAAVAWTFKNIAKYGGSTEQIFVSGASAGGYLTKMVGLDKSWLEPHGIDADRIAGLISLSGHTITHFTVRGERGINGKRPVVDQLAPLYHVRKEAPPMLLVTGDRDKELFGRYEEVAYFHRMMKVAGHRTSTLHELEGFDHGGMTTPALPILLKFVRETSSKLSQKQ